MSDESPRRGSRDTPRWTRRLTLALGASLAVHAAVLALPIHPPLTSPIDVQINHTVEIGLDEALPGSPVPSGTAPSIDAVPTARPTPATPPAHRPPRVTHAPPSTPPPLAPDPPEAHLPSLVLRPTEAPSLILADGGASAPDVLLATADDAGMPDVALAMMDDGGAGDASAEIASATDAGTSLPGLANAAPDLAPAVPAGSVVTLLLRVDRLRANPNGERVRNLMMNIQDWQDVLGGTEIDPVRDFDTVLLASADPVGDTTHPPDLMALVHMHAPRGFLRASVEQMAGVRTPEDPDAGSLYARFAPGTDGGALARPTRPIWHRQGGAEVATIERYHGRRSFALLSDNLAAIAAPERVPALLSVLARRPPAATVADPALVALLQADGLRHLVQARSGPTAVPTHLDLGVLATGTHEAPDGGATLVGVCQYDSPTQAARAVVLFSQVLANTDTMITTIEHSLGGMTAAATGAVHFGVLHATLAAVHAEADGARVRISATLSPRQVAELLNDTRLAGMFQ